MTYFELSEIELIPFSLVDPDGKTVNLAIALIGAAVGGTVAAGFSYHMDPGADPRVHAAAAVGGAISGAAAGFTLGMSTLPSLATGAAFSGAGNTLEQGMRMNLGAQDSFDSKTLGTNMGLGSVISAAAGKLGIGFMVEKGLKMQGYAASDLAQAASYRGMGEMLSGMRNVGNEAFTVMGRAGALDFSAQTLSNSAKWSLGAGTGIAAGAESFVGGAISGAMSGKP